MFHITSYWEVSSGFHMLHSTVSLLIQSATSEPSRLSTETHTNTWNAFLGILLTTPVSFFTFLSHTFGYGKNFQYI